MRRMMLGKNLCKSVLDILERLSKEKLRGTLFLIIVINLFFFFTFEINCFVTSNLTHALKLLKIFHMLALRVD